MKRLALAAVAVVALAGALTATAASEDNSKPQPTHHAKPPTACTAPAFDAFAAKVWRLIYWDRRGGNPKPATIAAFHRRLRCAASPAHRAAMKRKWRQARAAFFEHRHAKLAERQYLEAIDPPGASVLAAIRACESGGDYGINSGNGFYGAYQFTLSTWQSVGGSGYPHEASPREQDERAAKLYRVAGPGPWPVCGV